MNRKGRARSDAWYGARYDSSNHPGVLSNEKNLSRQLMTPRDSNRGHDEYKLRGRATV
jgi:hypothetical protein